MRAKIIKIFGTAEKKNSVYTIFFTNYAKSMLEMAWQMGMTPIPNPW